MIIVWIIFAYICGALPLALWIGFLAGVDIRTVGDGNPGATNVFRAAGWKWGVWAILADSGKAAVPVGLAYQIFGIISWEMFLIAIAPSIGHAFSIFQNGRGGKALATMLGAWIGLTLYEMPAVMLPMLVFWFLFITVDGWASIFTALGGLIYLLAFNPNPLFIAVIIGEIIIIAWTHRHDLVKRPRIRERWLRQTPNTQSE